MGHYVCSVLYSLQGVYHLKCEVHSEWRWWRRWYYNWLSIIACITTWEKLIPHLISNNDSTAIVQSLGHDFKPETMQSHNIDFLSVYRDNTASILIFCQSRETSRTFCHNPVPWSSTRSMRSHTTSRRRVGTQRTCRRMRSSASALTNSTKGCVHLIDQRSKITADHNLYG